MFNSNDFILWELDGKDKRPLSYKTGLWCDATDEANRTSYEQACICAKKMGKNVGFVFTDTNPFFFVDLDNAIVDGVTRPECQEILDHFDGAFMETSQSGTGIHIIGSYEEGTLPYKHACKAKAGDDSFDALFTHHRFVALTMKDVRGNPEIVMSDKLRRFAEWKGLLSDARERVRDARWTTEPIEGGIESDNEIIDRACDAKSTLNIFGHGVTFLDLWTNNEEKLAARWKGVRDGSPYDASRADASMAQHLAFWTGGNCEQMERIMRLSALERPKWDERDDYLRDTIMNAVSLQKGFFGAEVVEVIDPPPPPPPPVETEYEILPMKASVVKEPRYVTVMEQLVMFKGCVYVASVNEVMLANGRMLKPEAFKNRYGGHLFETEKHGKVIDDAFKIFIGSKQVAFPKVDDMFFDPSLPERALVDNCINTYVPVDIKATPGDVSLFLQHLEKLLPDERDRRILLDYLAACAQRPGDKFQWAPMIQGVEGNGKTLLAVALRNAVGRRYFHMQDPEDLANVFNSWLERAIIVCVEEVFVNRRHELSNRMKTMITNRDVPLHAKNQNQRSATNCAKFILMSNHKGGVLKYKNDRRYAVFFTAQQSREDKRRDGMDKAYFKRLYGWIESDGGKAALNWYLQHREITTDMMADAPVTTSTAEAIEMSLGVKEQLLLESIELEDVGFRGDMICTAQVDEAFKAAGIRGVSPRRRKELLESIGYISTGQKVRLHSTRGVLYVRDGSPVSTLPAQEIMEQFRILNDGP